MTPIIMHLDMNSYFASVEQQDNLAWRGKPVGVCEHLGGIIIAASVEAKKWGIKTGTPVWEAKKLYPKIILTPTRPDRYRFYNRRMVKLVSDYSSAVEVYSIDEVFVDLTKACNVRAPAYKLISLSAYQLVNPFEEAVNIAKEIKKRFKTEVGDWVRCSIGIAENKLLAKIASDLKKPDGLVVVASSVTHKGHSCATQGCPLWLTKDELYHQLKLIDIPGIGRRQESNLNKLGIKTLKDLRDYPKSHLVSRFGNIMGHHLYNLGQLKASWKAPVYQEKAIKSMGHMYTLPFDFRKPEFFLPVLYKLCEMVGRRLRRKGLAGNMIHVYAHDKNYEGVGKSLKLDHFVQDGREIFLECSKIIDGDVGAGLSSAHSSLSLRVHPSESKTVALAKVDARPPSDNGRLKPAPTEFKLIGITVAGLQPYVNQLSLFGEVERNTRLVKALDKINDKYGEFTILRAQMLPAGKAFSDSIGFGRVKELG